jgi:hypothetical protein
LLIIIILNFLVVLHQGLLSLLRQTYIHRQWTFGNSLTYRCGILYTRKRKSTS